MSLDLALATGEFPRERIEAKNDLKEINTLVERLLELARLDHFLLRKEEVNLSALVEETIDRHQQFADQKTLSLNVIAPAVKVLVTDRRFVDCHQSSGECRSSIKTAERYR